MQTRPSICSTEQMVGDDCRHIRCEALAGAPEEMETLDRHDKNRKNNVY